MTSRETIAIGALVDVVQKHDQQSGRLTRGYVAQILTSSTNHHRGIKVRLGSGIVGRVQHILRDKYVSPSKDDAVSETPVRRAPTLLDAFPARKWTCCTCSSANGCGVGVCGNCIQADSDRFPDKTTDDFPEWSCLSCTYSNQGSRDCCELCEVSRSTSINENTQNSQNTDWVCSQCTFLNDCDLLYCDMCSYPK